MGPARDIVVVSEYRGSEWPHGSSTKRHCENKSCGADALS